MPNDSKIKKILKDYEKNEVKIKRGLMNAEKDIQDITKLIAEDLKEIRRVAQNQNFIAIQTQMTKMKKELEQLAKSDILSEIDKETVQKFINEINKYIQDLFSGRPHQGDLRAELADFDERMKQYFQNAFHHRYVDIDGLLKEFNGKMNS